MKRLQIRLPESVHERVHKLSRQDNVSMNQFMVTAISNEVVRQETHAFFKARVDAFDEDEFLRALDEIPAHPPEKKDRLPSSQ